MKVLAVSLALIAGVLGCGYLLGEQLKHSAPPPKRIGLEGVARGPTQIGPSSPALAAYPLTGFELQGVVQVDEAGQISSELAGTAMPCTVTVTRVAQYQRGGSLPETIKLSLCVPLLVTDSISPVQELTGAWQSASASKDWELAATGKSVYIKNGAHPPIEVQLSALGGCSDADPEADPEAESVCELGVSLQAGSPLANPTASLGNRVFYLERGPVPSVPL
jgi:hypothetical protein